MGCFEKYKSNFTNENGDGKNTITVDLDGMYPRTSDFKDAIVNFFINEGTDCIDTGDMIDNMPVLKLEDKFFTLKMKFKSDNPMVIMPTQVGVLEELKN